MTQMFGFLATPLGMLMRLLYTWVGNYGWALILFTILIRIVLLPLGFIQQKSSARTAAFQPLIKEIQKKWANDKNRQNQEMQKFYQENNIKMTGGCLPAIVNMLVIFSIIAVVQSPVQYIIGMPDDQIQNATVIVAAADESIDPNNASQNYTFQSVMVGEIKEDPQHFIDGVDVDGKNVAVEKEWVDKVVDFNFNFLGMNLANSPALKFDRYLIMPILSILTMLASQIIIMKTSGTGQMQGQSSMWIMTIVTGVMFGYFAFRVPVGFSLYYTISNVVMTLQQLVVRRVYSPDKIREQVLQEMEDRKKASKAKKVVKLKDQTGDVVEKELSDSEIARLRLAKARELDAQRYIEEEGRPELPPDEPDIDDIGEEMDVTPELPEAKGDAPEEAETKEAPAQEPYKPGRRKRAKQNRDGQKNLSFAEQERAREGDLPQES